MGVREYPIRVLHVIDKFSMDGVNPSSCTRLFAQWTPRFDAKRFAMVYCGLKSEEPAGEWLRERGNRVFYLGMGKFSPGSVAAIARLAREERAHILHLHGYSSANFGRLAGPRCGAPVIVHEHAILKVQPHQYVADFLLRNRMAAAVAVSEAVKRFMVRGRSVPPDRIAIINNGVNLDEIAAQDPAAAAAARAELGISADSPVIGTVTRFREEKGNRYFIEAAAKVVREIPRARFVLVGDGPLRAELEALAASTGVRDSIIFAGFRKDVPALLSLMSVNVIPSLTEGFPLALVEAMAAGNAIVATRVGGICEVAEDGVQALLVPPADPSALAEKILAVLRDPALAQRLARGALDSSRLYSVENNVQKLEGLYEKVLGGPPT